MFRKIFVIVIVLQLHGYNLNNMTFIIFIIRFWFGHITLTTKQRKKIRVPPKMDMEIVLIKMSCC